MVSHFVLNIPVVSSTYLIEKKLAQKMMNRELHTLPSVHSSSTYYCTPSPKISLHMYSDEWSCRLDDDKTMDVNINASCIFHQSPKVARSPKSSLATYCCILVIKLLLMGLILTTLYLFGNPLYGRVNDITLFNQYYVWLMVCTALKVRKIPRRMHSEKYPFCLY